MSTDYVHKPTPATGEPFDGSPARAQALQAWVLQESGLAAVLAPVGDGVYRLSIPTPAGYQALEAGMELLHVGTDFWPIDAKSLEANYDEAESVSAPAGGDGDEPA